MVGSYTKLCIIILFMISGSLSSQGQQRTSLDQYQWTNRLLIVHSTTIQATEQLKLFETVSNALMDRDLLRIQISKDSVWINGIYEPMHSSRQLTEALGIGPGFECLLIGKDGGIKNRTMEVRAPSFYFGLIDQMPMRRQEIKVKN